MKTIDIVISYNLFCQFELIYTLFETHFISLWTVNTLFDGFISKVILDPTPLQPTQKPIHGKKKNHNRLRAKNSYEWTPLHHQKPWIFIFGYLLDFLEKKVLTDSLTVFLGFLTNFDLRSWLIPNISKSNQGIPKLFLRT